MKTKSLKYLSMSTNIFPGHFQPFHKGHLLVVQGMMKMSGNATIVICGSKMVAERREMISAALLLADITEATIIDVADKPTNGEWVDAIIDAAGHPSDPLVWSGNEAVRKMFEEKGIATQKIVPAPIKH